MTDGKVAIVGPPSSDPAKFRPIPAPKFKPDRGSRESRKQSVVTAIGQAQRCLRQNERSELKTQADREEPLRLQLQAIDPLVNGQLHENESVARR